MKEACAAPPAVLQTDLSLTALSHGKLLLNGTCALLQETPARTYSSVQRMLLQQVPQGTSEQYNMQLLRPQPSLNLYTG